MTRLLTTTLLLFLAVISRAQTLYVDNAFQGSQYDGASWATAFPSLQEAIQKASLLGGADIWIKKGVYTPGGDRTSSFILPPNTRLYGGFRGRETDLSQRNWKTNRTILSGNIGDKTPTNNSSYHILIAGDHGSIDGIILTGGMATGINEASFGGALFIPTNTTRFTINNCTIEKNRAVHGGAIANFGAALSISNTTFYANEAESSGGAIYHVAPASLTSHKTTFSANTAKLRGGALLLLNTQSNVLHSSSFLYNTTEGEGGAIHLSTTTPNGILLQAEECRFQNNRAQLKGGALFNSGPFSITAKRCFFANNSAAKGAAVAANANQVHLAIEGCRLIANTSAPGIQDVSITSGAQSFDSIASLLASDTRPSPIIEERPHNEEAEPIILRSQPDLHLYDTTGQKISLSSLLKANPFTIMITGCLTDPRFIATYSSYEQLLTVYEEQKPNFFYIYRTLAHPENHRFVTPYTLNERAQHAALAAERYQTDYPWYCDDITNETAQWLEALGNNLFIFNEEGTELFAGSYEELSTFTEMLHQLIPPPVLPEADDQPVTKLTPRKTEEKKQTIIIEPYEPIKTKAIRRPNFDPKNAPYFPLQIKPINSKHPFYAKLRIEADQALLKTGSGFLYAGFHIDPIYNVAWENIKEPLSYSIKPPAGCALAPSKNQAQKILEHPTDADPREFILEVRNWSPEEPIQLSVNYPLFSIQSKWKREITQHYIVYLKRDDNAGRVIGREISLEEINKGKTHAIPTQKRNETLFEKYCRIFDIDRDGRIILDEAPRRIANVWNTVDLNNNGILDPEELKQFIDTQELERQNRLK
jgi:predicted outer membrane repeat protein